MFLRENIEFGLIHKKVPKGGIDEVCEIVGLTGSLWNATITLVYYIYDHANNFGKTGRPAPV